MNRSELVAKFAQRHSIPKAHAQKLVSLILEEMSDSLAKDEGIEFRGFGSFFIKSYEARQVKNPRNGEKLWMETRKKARFRASKVLLSKLNNSLM